MKNKKQSKLLKNKSGLEIRFMILLALGVIVLVVMAFVIPNLLGKSSTQASTQLIGTGDFDGDGIVNYFDKCKCIYAETENGCPEGTNVEDPNHDREAGC